MPGPCLGERAESSAEGDSSQNPLPRVAPGRGDLSLTWAWGRGGKMERSGTCLSGGVTRGGEGGPRTSPLSGIIPGEIQSLRDSPGAPRRQLEPRQAWADSEARFPPKCQGSDRRTGDHRVLVRRLASLVLCSSGPRPPPGGPSLPLRRPRFRRPDPRAGPPWCVRGALLLPFEPRFPRRFASPPIYLLSQHLRRSPGCQV